MKIQAVVNMQHRSVIFAHTESNAPRQNALITVEGDAHKDLAEAIAKLLTEHQCKVCGGLAGKHYEHFVKTGQDGFGTVEGHYARCPFSV